MKKALFTLSGLILIICLFSCSPARFGNGCPDARRAIGYGCFGGR
jgi:hypothetical protein